MFIIELSYLIEAFRMANLDIQEMFNKIAQNYDRLNDVISFNGQLSVKKKAIENVPLKSDFKILDVCTGTGDIAIYIAKSVVKNGKVIGIDFSDNMLAIAKNKAQGVDNIEFFKADALNLPFAEGEFDASFVSFGLRNIPKLKEALLEMKRVTKKGGFVVNLDTGKPKGIFKFFHYLYFFMLVPILGRLFNGDESAYKYLPESTKKFPSSQELSEIFCDIGLSEIKTYDFIFGAISQQVGKV